MTYLKGNRASSGFYNVEDVEYVTRLYRLHARNRLLHVESVAVEPGSLDPRYVFVLDVGRKIFVWSGKLSKNTMVSKGRLLAEKINKNERKNYSEVITYQQSEEEEDFWKALGVDPMDYQNYEPEEHVPDDFTPFFPCLYRVGLGMGYLELPQGRTLISNPFLSLLNPRLPEGDREGLGFHIKRVYNLDGTHSFDESTSIHTCSPQKKL